MTKKRCKAKYILLLFVLPLCFSFSSCSLKPKTDSSPAPISEQESNNSCLHLLRSGYPLGSASKNGYYYLQYREDASLNICYVDYASAQQLVLCNQPNCMHNSDACSAWIPYSASTAGIYDINNKLYVIHYGSISANDYTLFGAAAAPSIEIRNPDGSNPKTLVQLPTNCYFSGDFATDGYNLYGMLKEVSSPNSEEINLSTQLVKISLEDGNLETIREIDQLEPSIVGASGQHLAISYYLNDSSDDSMLPTSLCCESFNICSGETFLLCTFSRSDGSFICVGDRLLFIDKATYEVTSYSILSGIAKTLYTLPLADYSDLYCSYSLPNYAVLLLYPKDSDADVVHALLSIDSGELIKISQKMNTDDTSNDKPRTVEFAAEMNENFLVLSGLHYQNVSFKTGESASISMPTAYYTFSTIKQSDYLDNIEAFSKIADLTNNNTFASN